MMGGLPRIRDNSARPTKAGLMPTRFDGFQFEHRLQQKLETFSSLGESRPAHPLTPRKQPLAFVSLDSQNAVEERRTAKQLEHEYDYDQAASDLTQTASHQIKCESGDIWIQGNTLLCACPDCRAPMSIRLWLELADCWRCRTSIGLTEEQLTAAAKLVTAAAPASPARTPQRKPASRPTPIAAAAPLARVQPARNDRPSIDPVSPATNEAYDPRQRELESLTRGSWAARTIRRGFHLTPAWLVSFLVHLIAILILALIVFSDKNSLDNTITLSTFFDSDKSEGGKFRIENPLDLLQDDLEIASKMEQANVEMREVLQKANQDARDLIVDPRPTAPLPDISVIKKNITTRPDQLMSFAARDPRVRAEIIRNEGGTTITEAAVARGLRWLASVQNKDGSWSLDNYRLSGQPNNQGDIMGTSLALLPMLGAGQTHEHGMYKQNVAAGLAWLINNQNSNGDLRAGYTAQAGMYAHGQAAIVLCEVLAMTGDQRFHEPAQKAIKFIEYAQHAGGGWRYQPKEPGDTSVVGWQLMALHSARAANMNLEIDDATLKLADYFLDTVAARANFNDKNKTPLPTGSAYCYQPGREATPTMTAEAILCRMYLGWKKQDPRLAAAIKWLVNDHLPNEREKNLYYWYYGTQVMHHFGGKPWKIWNDRMRELLISTQETSGRYPGSWSPDVCEWGSRGGRIYTTSLAVCTLEVYYRHLPLFKQIELDE